MANLLCMVRDVSYSEEDLTFISTSTIRNNLASKKISNWICIYVLR